MLLEALAADELVEALAEGELPDVLLVDVEVDALTGFTEMVCADSCER